MNRWQAIGLCFAIASAALGTAGLLKTRPLPPSARLGAMAPMDANNDGRLSASEWIKARRAEPAMRTLDKNHSGYLEPDEVRPRRGGGGGGGE